MPTVCKHDDGERLADFAGTSNRCDPGNLEWARLERLAAEIAEQLVTHHGGVTRLTSAVEDVDVVAPRGSPSGSDPRRACANGRGA